MKGLLRYFVLLAVVMLVAAACSSDDSDSGTETTEAATETTEAATETTEAAPDTTAAPVTTAAPTEKIDIDFWAAFSDYRFDYSVEKAAAFNEKHPEYNVRVTSFASYNDVFDAAVLAVDSGEPPGLIHFFEAATRQALDAVDGSGNPMFKSVTDAIGGRTDILGEPVVLESVIDAARNYYTVDGSFYSMPWNTSSTVMFSNMTILNEAGITEPPETWADVETAC
ncbi:MAG: extracellular solute-binding protein, partial [Actinomycetota bacterium]|nr:extracellular solute-binding protein [Actinomycetota bacterium]